MKRDFIPQDQISETEFLIGEQIAPLTEYSGTVKLAQNDGTVYIFSEEVEGCTESDPSTWVIAQPATWLKTAMIPQIGKQVLWRYSDLDQTIAKYYGYDQDIETSANGTLLKDAIHEENSASSITYNITNQTYKISTGLFEIQVSPTSVTITNGVITVNPFTEYQLLRDLITAYNVHTHVEIGPPGPTGPPVPTVVPPP